jgi:EamA domain-containing membrane protein RarD
LCIIFCRTGRTDSLEKYQTAYEIWLCRDRAAIASVLYLSLAGTVVTFSLYFWLLRHVAANRMSLIAYVTPVVALLLGGLVGREPITGWTLAGTGLVLAGVGLVVRRRSTQIREQQGLAHPAAPPAPPRSRDPGSPGN